MKTFVLPRILSRKWRENVQNEQSLANLMSDKELVFKIYNTELLKTTVNIQEWKMNKPTENGKIAEWILTKEGI